MRILLDLQGCQSASRFRGIGRYTLSLAKAIARNAGEHEVWLLLSDLFPDTVMPLRQEFRGLVPSERIAVFSAPGPVAECDPANSPRARVAELVREHAIAELSPDVVHVGSLFEGFVDDAVTSIGCLENGVLTAVTLYDLIPLLNPDRYLAKFAYKDCYLRKIESLKRADLLLAVSETAGREAISVLGVAGERVFDIASAADDRFRPLNLAPEAAAEVLRRFGLSKPFIMYVGVIEPRKNFDGLIRAYAQLPDVLRTAHQLLLVAQGGEGDRDSLRRLAASSGLAPRDMVVVDHVTDDNLVALYSLCKLFVFPSLHEGFGLPALEAMTCGAAVIGSNTTSIPEVIGRNDALFDPSSPRAIARAMQRALFDEAFHESLRRHGVQQAKKFSWGITARRALEALETLHDDCRTRGEPFEAGRYRRLIEAIGEQAAVLSDQDLLRTADAVASNFSSGPPRQLLVDVSELAERDARTGIQRVTRAILKQLLKNPPRGYRIEPVRYDPGGRRYRLARAFAAAFKEEPVGDDCDEWVEPRPGDVFLGLDLGLHCVPQAATWFHSIRRRGVRVVFVVYDVLLLQRPDWWPPGMRDIFERWVKSVAACSDTLVGISRSVTDELRSWVDAHGVSQDRQLAFAHFHLGADFHESIPDTGLPADAVETLRKLKSAPTFLMVGTVEPRKAHAQTLSAFDELWGAGLDVKLIIVGKQGWMVDALAHALRSHSEVGKRLFWLEGISDDYLEKIYAASTCLIAASEGEGFGLPLIEAAHHKVPIIARDIPVFREVAGENAFYFSGASPEALAGAVREWLSLNAEGKAPLSEAIPLLTWAESTRQLISAVIPRDTDKDCNRARS